MVKNLYRSLAAYVNHRWGVYIFPLFFCVEAVFFMPVNTVLAVFCLGQRERAYFYAILATIASIVGAALAYYLGALFFSSIGVRLIETFSSMETFNKLIGWYKSYQALTLMCASVAPIPFKLITFSAGFCHLNFASFLIYVFIGRITRFMLVAGLTKAYGMQILEFTNKYFKYLALSALVFVALALVLFR